MQKKLLLLVFASIIIEALTQELADESPLDKRGLSAFAKRARFAFAKRYPSRFAFAKRSDDDDMEDLDKRTMRFAFAKKSLRNFAFAKRDPYLSFA